jgi:hypothetical protein
MNDTKNFAKIILAAICLFFLVKLIPQLAYPVYFLFASFSWQSLGITFISVVICGIYLFLIWYFLFYRRDGLADKIISSSTSTRNGFDKEIPWFPLAVRLSCIFAGLYLMSTVLYNLMRFLTLLRWYVERDLFSNSAQSPLPEIFRLTIIFAVGIYLLFGAPHFVRWQVKKTLEQCREFENSGSVASKR